MNWETVLECDRFARRKVVTNELLTAGGCRPERTVTYQRGRNIALEAFRKLYLERTDIQSVLHHRRSSRTNVEVHPARLEPAQQSQSVEVELGEVEGLSKGRVEHVATGRIARLLLRRRGRIEQARKGVGWSVTGAGQARERNIDVL